MFSHWTWENNYGQWLNIIIAHSSSPLTRNHHWPTLTNVEQRWPTSRTIMQSPQIARMNTAWCVCVKPLPKLCWSCLFKFRCIQSCQVGWKITTVAKTMRVNDGRPEQSKNNNQINFNELEIHINKPPIFDGQSQAIYDKTGSGFATAGSLGKILLNSVVCHWWTPKNTSNHRPYKADSLRLFYYT